MKKRPTTLKEVADSKEIDASLREFCDSFYLAAQEDRQSMISDEPSLTGNKNHDAYIAAAAEHLARQYKLAVPAWTKDKSRFLRHPYFPIGLESLKAQMIKESPPSFRTRLIFVEMDPLYRPRREKPLVVCPC